MKNDKRIQEIVEILRPQLSIKSTKSASFLEWLLKEKRIFWGRISKCYLADTGNYDNWKTLDELYKHFKTLDK